MVVFVGGGDGGVCGWVRVSQIRVGVCMLLLRLFSLFFLTAYFNLKVLFLSVFLLLFFLKSQVYHKHVMFDVLPCSCCC